MDDLNKNKFTMEVQAISDVSYMLLILYYLEFKENNTKSYITGEVCGFTLNH